MVCCSFSNIKRLSSTNKNLVELFPESKSLRLSLILFAVINFDFTPLNKIVRFFNNFEFWSRVRISNLICMYLNQEKINIIVRIVIKAHHTK